MLDKNEVINFIKRYAVITMNNVIRIGYKVDRNLVEPIDQLRKSFGHFCSFWRQKYY